MPLRLRYVPSVAPILDEILAPLIQRHIDFKLRDSFRIITPDAESRQDLEACFLEREALGGVLIGKSLLTLHSLAQGLLLEHPSPRPLASLPAQRKALRQALRQLQPEWNLDSVGLRRCVRELQGLRRLSDLRVGGRMGLGLRVEAEFQKILEARFGAWTLERLQREAWQLLGKQRAGGLELVEECWFLGFRFPEAALLNPIEALMRAYPKMDIHLFLPPPEQFLDAEGRLEPWLKRLESLAGAGESQPGSPLARLQVCGFATPVHEARAACNSARAGIWTPPFSPVAPLLEAELAASAAPRGAALTETAVATQIPAFLSTGLAPDSEEPVPFSTVMTEAAPLFQSIQEKLAVNADFTSLRFLEAARQWLLETARAEALDPETRPRSLWLEELQEDWAEFRLAPSASLAQRLAIRRFDRSGLVPREGMWVAGMNEGSYPSPPAPAFFEEESQRFFTLHEESLAFRQVLHLAKGELVFSYSQCSLSGRALLPSPLLADLEAAVWRETPAALELRSASPHPYFSENVSREANRHRSKELGIDSGLLSSLLIQGRILAELQTHPLSATYLDDYAKCPWRYFAKRSLQLQEEPQEDLEIEPRRRGSLMHGLLESVFAGLIEGFFQHGKIPSAPEVATGLETAFARLQEKTLSESSPVPRVLVSDQLERLRRAAESLLGEEQAVWNEAPERLLPRHLEWRFGRRGQAPLGIELPGGPTLPLNGAIDRIDVSADGSRFLLIDYKSSGASELAKEIRAGLGLQLWIYLKAVRHLLYPRSEALGGLYWDLKELKKDQGLARREAYQPFLNKKLSGRSKSFLKDEEFEALEASLEESLQSILARILRGDFSLAPAQCLGGRCEFREICRYDDKPKN